MRGHGECTTAKAPHSEAYIQWYVVSFTTDSCSRGGAVQARAGSGATSGSDAKSGAGSRGSRAGRPLPLGVLPFEGLQLGPPLGAQQPIPKPKPSTWSHAV